MCGTDECVDMVKGLTAELFREQRELVARLNAMQERITQDPNLISKTLRKIEWMEEKERSVERLNKAVASLRCALEADVASREMVATAGIPVSSASDKLSDDDAESEASGGASRRPSEVSHSSPHPRAFSRIFCEQPPPQSLSYLNLLQTDLYKAFVTNLDAGFIRLAHPAPRRMLREPPGATSIARSAEPPLPHFKLQPRADWAARSADEGQASRKWFAMSDVRVSSLPELPAQEKTSFLARLTIPKKLQRLGTSFVSLKDTMIGL
ncbi:hypothetical protein T484DRAFT_2023735 [Baffinella frigidus]|nr:hypothetical protein T484DRAFT_2023735 [Cryptophyta sp. CCMP2293]